MPHSAIENQLKHQQYKDCVKTLCQTYTTVQTIRSEQHNVYTKKIIKLSLSLYDDKQYILVDGERTLVYGHYKIQPTHNIIHRHENQLYRTPERDTIISVIADHTVSIAMLRSKKSVSFNENVLVYLVPKFCDSRFGSYERRTQNHSGGTAPTGEKELSLSLIHI